MTDVALYDSGSVIGFAPLTEAAQDWFRRNVETSEWQWLGDTLWVDQRLASDLIAGIIEAGLLPGIAR